MKTIQLFTYAELNSEEAKSNAREWYKHHVLYPTYQWGEITELIGEELKDWGYPIQDINWSLSYCQGDGVAFYGTIDSTELEPLIIRLCKNNKKMRHLWFKKLRKLEAIRLKISRNSFGYRYSHYNTMDVEVEGYFNGLNKAETNNLEKFMDWLENEVQIDVKIVSIHLEKLGYKAKEYITSDENIHEDLLDSFHYFNESGLKELAS